MKKYALLCVVIIGIGSISCKKDRQQIHHELVGKWSKTNFNTVVSAQQHEDLEFNSNATMTIRMYFTDPQTGALLGYGYKYTANYRINDKNNLVDIYNVVQFSNTGQGYTDEDKLTRYTHKNGQSFTFDLNTDYTQLKWTVVCPPAADCVGTQTYTRL